MQNDMGECALADKIIKIVQHISKRIGLILSLIKDSNCNFTSNNDLI